MNTIPPTEWQCKDCQQLKPFNDTYFYKDPSCPYGLKSTCKVCLYAKQKQDRKEHPEKHNKAVKNYRVKNLERHLEIERRSRENNRERRREQERLRRIANPEQFRENKRRYRQTEKGKAKGRVDSRNGKTGRRGAPGKYTVADVERMYTSQRGRCYYCRLPFKKGKNAYQVDHIVPWTRGGSNDPSNLVLACPACNMSKGDKLLHEWPQGGRLL